MYQVSNRKWTESIPDIHREKTGSKHILRLPMWADLKELESIKEKFSYSMISFSSQRYSPRRLKNWPTRTPTHKLKSGFLMLRFQEIGSSLVSIRIIFEAPQSELQVSTYHQFRSNSVRDFQNFIVPVRCEICNFFLSPGPVPGFENFPGPSWFGISLNFPLLIRS